MKHGHATNADAMAHAHFAAGAAGCGYEHEVQTNPAVSERQRRYMGAELGRLRAGKKTRTGMSEQQLSEYASK